MISYTILQLELYTLQYLMNIKLIKNFIQIEPRLRFCFNITYNQVKPGYMFIEVNILK